LPIFRTERQAELLRLLLLQPERRFKGVELAELTGDLPGTTSKELRRLVDAGLIEEQKIATAKLYRAATDSPFYEHLRALVELSMGPEMELRRRLSAIDGIDVAVIFGSWARGKDLRPTSDVDVLVVGTAAYEQLADAANEIEPLIGREVQLMSYTWDELDARIADDSAFVADVLRDAERLRGRLKT
jgi:predicted nucleotidyltransferase